MNSAPFHSRPRRVGIDVDGVLADLLTPLMSIVSELLQKDVGVGHVETWDLDDLFAKHDASHLVPELWKRAGSPGFCRTLSPYPGAVEGVAALRQAGADLFIVTSPLHDAATWTHDREVWLHTHFGIDRRHVVHCHAKRVFSGAMLVDDKPSNILTWGEEHGFDGAVLWDQSWNQDARDERLQRTSSWKAVLDLYNSLGASVPSSAYSEIP